MREVVRVVARAGIIACMRCVMVAAFSSGALAQLGPQSSSELTPVQAGQQPQPTTAEPWPEFKQVPLTEKLIESVIAAQLELIKSDLGDDDAFDAVVKKHGLSGPEEYKNVFYTIDLVLYGFDPYTKKYVGPEAAIEARVAEVKARETRLAQSRKEELDRLNAELEFPPPPLEHTGNIDLVAKHYRELYVLGEWP